MLSLSLPLPISKNRLHDNRHAWTTDEEGNRKQYTARKLSDEYEAYQTEVWAEVMRQTTPEQREQLQGKRLAIAIQVRFPDDGRRHDVANCLDGLLDSLKGPLGADDEHFWLIDLRRHEIAGIPECVVLIGEAM